MGQRTATNHRRITGRRRDPGNLAALAHCFLIWNICLYKHLAAYPLRAHLRHTFADTAHSTHHRQCEGNLAITTLSRPAGGRCTERTTP